MSGKLFIAIPYVALTLAIAGGLYRYFANRFSYTSLSSQLLESRQLFWGSVPWHYGIIPILLAHLFAGLFPRAAALVLRDPVRRAVLEVLGLSLGFLAVMGIVILVIRRLRPDSMARPATSPMDWILLGVLGVQVVSGVGVALFERWGSLWYLDTAVPWFWSIVTFQPNASTVASLPGFVQFHMVVGFIVIALFPFTRLVHIFTVPVTYMRRPYQVVVWNQRLHHDTPRRNESRPASDSPQVDRRRFLNRLSLGLGTLAATIVGVPSLWFLLGLRKVRQEWREVGSLDDFQVGSTVEVSFQDPSPLSWAGVTAKTAAWLRRTDAQQFIAFSVNCTHLGCPVRWLPKADLFMCPCHGGVFYNDGRVAAGPPPHRLTQYPVRIRNGIVEIRTSPLPIT
jgi:respiratory nitrate reductase gamma subunit